MAKLFYVVCIIIVLVCCTYTYSSTPTCQKDRDISLRHQWAKEYTYVTILPGVGVQQVVTTYITQPGKREMSVCRPN